MSLSDIIRESDALHARVQAFIRAFDASQPMPETFDQLALAIARFQARHVDGYSRYLRARGLDVTTLTTTSALPAVPTDAFKYARVCAFPESETPINFRTSGTTIGNRGQHSFRTAATVDLGEISFGRRALVDDGVRPTVLVLGPSPAELPESSLTHMFTNFVGAFSASQHNHYFIASDRILADELVDAIAMARTTATPVLLLGTSFAFVHLLDALGGTVAALSAGSRIVHTGGYKGKSREVEPADLTRWISNTFSISESWVTREYGMTELSSQFYASPKLLGPERFAEPPWARVIAVDPETLAPVADGEIGIARIEDLMNIDSAVVVQTQDRVRRDGEGFVLLGRLPGATPRGCSIAIDEIVGRG